MSTPVWQPEGRTHFRRGDFGGRPSYEDATFSWLRGVVKRWRSESNRPRLYYEVLVWGPDGQRASGLTQEFTADDLAGAKRWARHVMSEGASMAEVRGMMRGYDPRGSRFGDHTVEIVGTYDREDGARDARRRRRRR